MTQRIGAQFERHLRTGRVHHQLVGIGTFWAERTFIDGAAFISFYIDNLTSLYEYSLGAPYRAIGTDPIYGHCVTDT